MERQETTHARRPSFDQCAYEAVVQAVPRTAAERPPRRSTRQCLIPKPSFIKLKSILGDIAAHARMAEQGHMRTRNLRTLSTESSARRGLGRDEMLAQRLDALAAPVLEHGLETAVVLDPERNRRELEH